MSRILAPRQSGILVPKRPGREIAKDFNTINPADSDSVNAAKVESWIAKQLGEKLCAVYPNRNWAVRVDLRGRQVVVQAPDISTMHGYVLHMKERTIQQLVDEMPRVGGEILERGRVSRGLKVDEDEIETRTRDIRGNVADLDNS